MKTWQIVVVGLLSLALAGCQTDPNIALLEQDNRRKEDEIYRLREQLEDCQAELQAARSHGPFARLDVLRHPTSTSAVLAVVALAIDRSHRGAGCNSGAER